MIAMIPLTSLALGLRLGLTMLTGIVSTATAGDAGPATAGDDAPAMAGDAAAATAGSTVRVKDIASLQGVQSTPLIGYGLVVGLNKTGDRRQTIFSAQTLANMLERFGVLVPGDQVKIENIAAVLVTAELPAFVRRGGRLDVTVSSVGDARSLQGGTLLATALRGPDGSVYVLAQGPLTLGGFGAGRGAGTSVQVNHLTAGRVPSGGLVEAAPQTELPAQDQIMLALHEPDFTSANRLADAINADLGPGSAAAVDAGSVTVKVPSIYRTSLTSLMARLEPLPVTVDAPARVVINERTGTVVIGQNVRLGAAAVAHGNLSVKISTKYNASQPAPFSQGGQTQVVPETKLDVQEGDNKLIALPEGTTLDAVVSALNALGASPRDIIAIVQALKAAGALNAEIVIL
jgi:flagellar P-ring protein FlgI